MLSFRIILIWVVVASSATLAARKSETTSPSTFQYFEPAVADKKITLRISGKLRQYYLLEQSNGIELVVEGPTRLKLLSRAILASPGDTIEYRYTVQRKGSEKLSTISHKSFLSDKVSFAGETAGPVAESRAKVIEVPRGTQTYFVKLSSDARNAIAMRFATDLSELSSASSVIAMTPTEFTTEVDITSKEETLSYYRVGAGNRAILDLIGPATLKVLSRIEFDSSMTGKQKWKVSIREDGTEKSTYNLSAAKSDAATYRNPSSFVPSAAEVFYVDIPAGPHKYEFVLPDNHRSTLMRFMIPKSQLERE